MSPLATLTEARWLWRDRNLPGLAANISASKPGLLLGAVRASVALGGGGGGGGAANLCGGGGGGGNSSSSVVSLDVKVGGFLRVIYQSLFMR